MSKRYRAQFKSIHTIHNGGQREQPFLAVRLCCNQTKKGPDKLEPRSGRFQTACIGLLSAAMNRQPSPVTNTNARDNSHNKVSKIFCFSRCGRLISILVLCKLYDEILLKVGYKRRSQYGNLSGLSTKQFVTVGSMPFRMLTGQLLEIKKMRQPSKYSHRPLHKISGEWGD